MLVVVEVVVPHSPSLEVRSQTHLLVVVEVPLLFE